MTTGRLNQVSVVLFCALRQKTTATAQSSAADYRFSRFRLPIIEKIDIDASASKKRYKNALDALSRSCFLVQLCNREPRLRSLRRRPSDNPSSPQKYFLRV